MKTETAKGQLLEIAERISDMREIMGYSEAEMAEKTEVSLALYKAYESGEVDLPFTFIHKCALAFGIDIMNMAPKFKNKLAEPYWVRYEYSDELQHQPIHLTKHSGQEFDLVLSGALLVQVGSNKEVLHEGDSIYYNSSTPHGMIAVEGKDCVFCAMVMNGEDSEEY